MDEINNNIEKVDTSLIGWTQKEKELLKEVEDRGFKPISPTLAAQMSQLFILGYSCSDIANQNKGFTESDVLYFRKKYNWDEQKDKYISELTFRGMESLKRQKLESIEFLTNTMSVLHKRHKEKMLKYLQTGNPDDLPEFQINSMKMYKEIIETIAKITGEDKVQKHLVHADVRQDITVKGSDLTRTAISEELQSKLLRALASPPQKGPTG